MPNADSGFTGTEIVNYVKSWIGNESSAFQTFVEQSLPLAEMRFCKAHNWPFLHKSNLSLTVVSGTSEYALTTGTLGFYMSAEDVKSIYSAANGIYLKKVTLDEIRRFDPSADDGNSSAKLTHWAPTGDNRIVVYPPIFSDTTLKVDGKIRPGALHTLANYPTIPYHYQEAFMQYVIALALDRENDDRATNMKQVALGLIKQDIQDANSGLGNVMEPRIRSMAEQRLDGASANTDPLNMLFGE